MPRFMTTKEKIAAQSRSRSQSKQDRKRSPSPPNLPARRVPTLSMTVAKDIGVKELQGRNEVSESEAADRVDLLSHICAVQLQERINLLVVTCMDSCRYSREFFAKDEDKEWAQLMITHDREMKYLRSIIPLAVVAEKIKDGLAEEKDMRRRLWFLEQKTLQDICDVFNINCPTIQFSPSAIDWSENSYNTVKSYEATIHPPSPNPRYNKLVDTSNKYLGMVKTGLHPPSFTSFARDVDGTSNDHTPSKVSLSAGCPFIHQQDCPFRSADWVDNASYTCEHIRRKYPPLRPNPETTTYEDLAAHRAEVHGAMHPLIFSVAGDKVSKTPMRPQTASIGGRRNYFAEKAAQHAYENRHLPHGRRHTLSQ